jgi:hypothetical protein
VRRKNYKRPRCTECRGPLGADSLEGLCEPCWSTPPEIRNREIYGCWSVALMPEVEVMRRRAENERLSADARMYAKVRRRLFRAFKGGA